MTLELIVDTGGLCRFIFVGDRGTDGACFGGRIGLIGEGRIKDLALCCCAVEPGGLCIPLVVD